MKKLTKYQKAKIAIQIVNLINEIPNKGIFYVRCEEDNTLVEKIAKRSKIHISGYVGEGSKVDIGEYINLTYEDIEDRWERKLQGDRVRIGNHGTRMLPEFQVSDDLKELVKKFEEENIPSSGPCKTTLGEMFRAIQRIQYRVHNDGDKWYIIGSESFMSYMYLISMIDKLNYSSHSYNENIGNHEFKFNDEFLIENSWDGKISDVIEYSLAEDAEFIKYQLMDLLSNGKIEDTINEFDSRDFSKLKTESRYKY